MSNKSFDNICFVRVTNGSLHKYLKDIDIVGRIDENGDFIVYGCKNEDQPKFYQGIFEMDQEDEFFGFSSSQEVKEFWEDGGDGSLLCISKGDFERHETKES